MKLIDVDPAPARDGGSRPAASLRRWADRLRLGKLKQLVFDAGLASEASSAESDRMVDAIGRGHGGSPGAEDERSPSYGANVRR